MSKENSADYSHANQPSSSSRRVLAGRGAPGASPSVVGSLTEPSLLKGLYFDIELMKPFDLFVVTGSSLRDQPRSFILSLKDVEEAMADGGSCDRMRAGF